MAGRHNRKELINERFADGNHGILLVTYEQQASWLAATSPNKSIQNK
jgi:hypothetical protein